MAHTQLSLDALDLRHIVTTGDALVSSAGREFDMAQQALAHLDPKERLRAQKQDIKKRIGLGGEFVDDLQLIGEEDISSGTATGSLNNLKIAKGNVASQIGLTSMPDMSNMSARERAKMKRKLKIDAQSGKYRGGATLIKTAKSNQDDDDEEGGADDGQWTQQPGNAFSLRPLEQRDARLEDWKQDVVEIMAIELLESSTEKTATILDRTEDEKLVMESSVAAQLWLDLNEWPFEAFCEELMVDLFECVNFSKFYITCL
jgi:TATA-binding protein-associated factor